MFTLFSLSGNLLGEEGPRGSDLKLMLVHNCSEAKCSDLEYLSVGFLCTELAYLNDLSDAVT